MRHLGAIALSTWLLWQLVRKALKSKPSRQRSLKGPARVPAVRLVPRPQPLKSSSADEISVVSYNILADSFAKPARLPHARPHDLAWARRWASLQAELASLAADIICLQEVDVGRWEEMQACPAVKRYASVLQERDKGAVFGNATLYCPRRFTLCWEEHRSRALITAFSFYDAQNVQQILYVCNMHLEGSPYRPQDRVSQTRSALSRLSAHMAAHGLHPADAHVLVVGDFNSGPAESVATLLRRGRLEGGTTEPHLPNVVVTQASINHPFALQEVYSAAKRPLPFTRKVPGVASSLDWVWASESMAVSAVYWPLTVPAVSAPAGPAGWRLYNLPNADHPSDHLPIGAILRVKRAPVRGANGVAHVVHAAAAEAPEGSDAMPVRAAASSSSLGSVAASEGTPAAAAPGASCH